MIEPEHDKTGNVNKGYMKTRKIYFFRVIIVIFASLSFFNGAEANDAAKTTAPVVGHSIKNDVSPPIRNIIPPLPAPTVSFREIPIFRKPQHPPMKRRNLDPVLQNWLSPTAMPLQDQNLEGISNYAQSLVTGLSVLPPDTNGDIGLSHYVQWVNLAYKIWDLTNGTQLGPFAGNTLWSGFGGPCQTSNNGDPIVLYDRYADRWLMSQFALPNYPNGPFYQCIAISQTGDPALSWYRYAFLVSSTKMNDYPKFGIWPDGYYMSVNQFNAGTGTWAGGGAFVFDRDSMLAGLPATFIYFDLYPVDPDLGGMLPSHANGPNLPPSGSPNYFVQADDDASGYPQDQLEIWRFHVDWSIPANSSFTGPTILTTAPFDSNMCSYSLNCIPQPSTGAKLDALSDRLMYRLQYRNFGDSESMVLNHTVDVDGTNHGGIRWYELRRTTGEWLIHQQGSFAPDADNRWMGSIAIDRAGNIALGYSVSSNATYPSIRYTGRLLNDPPGTLPQGESTLIAGSGSQRSFYHRWGDYSSMSVDPLDDCTFWYTQEYYQTSSSSGWQTRIGSFSFPSCSGSLVSGIITDEGSPMAGVTLTLDSASGSMITTTDQNGFYIFTGLNNESYTITPDSTVNTYFPDHITVTINDADVSGQNFYACQSPVRIDGTPPAYYPTLQSAYDASSDGDIIQSQDIAYTEDLLMDINKSIIMDGGYDCSYMGVAGKTIINGTMTISDGTVTIGNFILQ